MTPEDRSAIAQETAALVLGALLPLFQAQAMAHQINTAKIDHMHTAIPNIDGMIGNIATILRAFQQAGGLQPSKPRPDFAVVPMRPAEPEAPQPV